MGLLKKIVPDQVRGGQTGAAAKRVCKNKEAAKFLFAKASGRLLDINQWPQISGSLSASFQLTDHRGKLLAVQRPVTGNRIRIKLPAPGNASGNGYDWVRVETIQELEDSNNDEEICALIVRPVAPPKHKTNEVAHFYTAEATSTFVVLRSGHILRAMEFGRNEVTNKEGGLLNRLRNMLVAIAAKAGFSKPQWKALMEGVLDGERQ